MINTVLCVSIFNIMSLNLAENRYVSSKAKKVLAVESLNKNNYKVNYTGKGIKVAVIDSGVEIDHPDLKGNIVGGYDFVENKPIYRDGDLRNGHGTHVSGIIAANGKIKGVAPEASLLVYRVVEKDGSKTDKNIISAIKKATEEGAEIINLSLRTEHDIPEGDVADAIRETVKKGVVVVKANGNYGPGPWTVKDVASLPEVISVGNATDNILTPHITGVQSGQSINLQLLRESKSFDEINDASIVTLTDSSNIVEESIKNKIILLEAKNFYEAEDIFRNFKGKGVLGVIVSTKNEEADSFRIFESLDFPIAFVKDKDYESLFNMASKERVHIKNKWGRKVFYDSSQGPTKGLWGLKPDIVAPGTDILSTVPQEVDESRYKKETGTSMAAPYISGVAALIKQAHPAWTPQQIKEAIANNAKLLYDEEGVLYPAYIQGSGFIDVEKAINADIFISPNNLSFGLLNAKEGKLEVERVLSVKNTSNESKEYNISGSFNGKSEGMELAVPKSITVKNNSQENITIKAKVDTTMAKGIYSGNIIFSSENDTKIIPFIILVEPNNYPIITDLYLEQRIFSLAKQENNNIYYYLPNNIDRLFIEAENIFSKSSEKMPIYEGENIPKGLGSIAWQGRDIKNNALKDGVYSFKALAYNKSRTTEVGGNTIGIIDNSAPEISISTEGYKVKGKIEDLMLKHKFILIDKMGFEKLISLQWKLANTDDSWKELKLSEEDEFYFEVPEAKLVSGNNAISVQAKDIAHNLKEITINMIKEKEIKEEGESGSKVDKSIYPTGDSLARTGSIIDMKVLISIGAIISLLGLYLYKKNKI